MKKYRLLKDLPNKSCWTIISEKDVQKYYDFFSYINSVEWFEEVKEEPKPKFKIWDYVVHKAWKRFIKIIDIKITEDNSFIYNYDSMWYYRDSELRKPTQEELEKYFR